MIADQLREQIYSILSRSTRHHLDSKDMSKTLDEVGIDSIDLVEVVMAIEQNLKIRLEDTEKIHECRTVGEIIEAITTSVYLATHTTTRLPRTFTNN